MAHTKDSVRLDRDSITDRRSPSAPFPLLDVAPVLVSLLISTAVIIRSAVTLHGRRAYVLFDDATISLTYARNLANGHGLVWNSGQHPVEGYSNLLWTLWMTVIELTHPADRLAALGVMVSGAALLAANVYVVVRITRRIAPESRLVPILTGFAVALYYALVSWTLIGMETGLTALLYSLALLCALSAYDVKTPSSRRNTLLFTMGVLLALATLTRDDALVVALMIFAFVFWKAHHRVVEPGLVALPVVLASAAHLAFRLAYYGLPLPNTYYLKIEWISLATRVGRGLVVLGQNLTLQLAVPIALAAAYFLLSARHGRKAAYGTWLLLGVVVVQALYMVYVGGDSYDTSYSDRYLAPVVPFLFVLAAMGAIELARATRSSYRPMFATGLIILAGGTIASSSVLPTWRIQIPVGPAWRFTSWAVIVIVAGLVVIILGILGFRGRLTLPVMACGLVVVAILSTNADPFAGWYQHNVTALGADEVSARVGIAVRRSTPVSATVAVTGAGNVTFFDHRRSIDLLGYSDHVIATRKPHNVTFLPGHDKWDYSYSIGKLRPDLVLGLYDPTAADIRNMTRWGYLSYGESIYYRPGWFNPTSFSPPRRSP